MPLLGTLLAITLSLKNYPAHIQPDTEFSVDAVLECSRCGDSYLRAVLFPSDSRYFGFTQNNSGDWISTVSDKTLYFLVTAGQTQSGTWSGVLKAKSDTTSRDYTGPGVYSFKLIRYTPSGSKSGESEAVTLNIIGPSLTPVPSPASTPFPTTVPPTSSLTPRPSPIPLVLAATAKPATPSPTMTVMIQSSPAPTPSPVLSASRPWTAWVLISLASAGLLFCAFLYFFPRVYTR